MKTVKAPIKIPKAPKRLFRTIWSIVSKQPSRYYMGDWHRSGNGWSTHAAALLREHGEEAGRVREMRGCNTVHCTAGWITYATPHGLELEEFIGSIDTSALGVGRQWLQSQSSYAQSVLTPAARAALLILEKSGWAPYVKGKDFLVSDDLGLKKLKQLTELETEYDGPPPAGPAKKRKVIRG